FKAPAAGAPVSGQLNAGTSCWVSGTGVTRVAFYLDNVALNTDTNASDGMQCVLDTTKFANGTHQLKATAFAADGSSRNDVIAVTVQHTQDFGANATLNEQLAAATGYTGNFGVDKFQAWLATPAARCPAAAAQVS